MLSIIRAVAVAVSWFASYFLQTPLGQPGGFIRVLQSVADTVNKWVQAVAIFTAVVEAIADIINAIVTILIDPFVERDEFTTAPA